MSSVHSLRRFLSERLAAAAEEIFSAVEKTLVEYEEEISRQRKLLDVWKPRGSVHGTELPQQRVCKEEEEDVLTDQQLCDQERNFSLDQENPEPPQIKEEQENLCISQDEEQLVVKQETDICMVTLIYDDGDHSEDQTLYLNPDESQTAAEEESVVSVSVNSAEVQEPNTGYQLLPHLAERQDHMGGKHGGSVSTANATTKPQKRLHKSNDVCNPAMLKNSLNAGQKSFKCETCGKEFPYKSTLNRHMTIHTGVKPYSCNFCSKRFNQPSRLKAHKIIHTGERPYSCAVCGKTFGHAEVLKSHKRIHTGEKPYSCNICNKSFGYASAMKVHRRIHTGEKPYSCTECGKGFFKSSALKTHLRVHTGEKPYSCETCGKCLKSNYGLMVHMRTHTGEKPFPCETCGNRFTDASALKKHLRRHTGEKPHACSMCGKSFFELSHLKRHTKVHTS